MFDTAHTPEKLKAQLLSSIAPESGLSAMEGGFADTMAGPVAEAMSEIYQDIAAVPYMIFPDETSGPYLDQLGSTYFNITRRPGTKATAKVTFTGKVGLTIPAGTSFLTADGLEFRLVETVTLPFGGTAAGRVEAAEVGTAYNIGAGQLVRMYINLSGLTSYTNDAATGGTDLESDASLLARIDERRKRPITGGNGWQYRSWAMNVAGVGEAKVVELADGPGTVGVWLVDANYAPASPEIVSAVQEYIDTQRPVGAGVTVQAPGETTVNLKITAQLSGTTAEAVEAAMVSELDTYLKSLIETAYTAVYYSAEENPSITISRNRLAALLLGIDGVQDFSALTINGTTSNLAVGKDNVPAVGTVEVTSS